MIWLVLGVATIPSIFWVANAARFQNQYPPRDTYFIGTIIGLAIFLYLIFLTIKNVKNFGDRNFNWQDNQPNLYRTYLSIFILEIISIFTWSFDEYAENISSYIFGIQDIFFQETEYGLFQFTIREVSFVAISLISLPLAIKLLELYFSFIQGIVSSAVFIIQQKGLPKSDYQEQEFEEINSESPQPGTKTERESSSREKFHAIADYAILRAYVQATLSAVAILIVVVVSLGLFMSVFQTSATRRAAKLIDSIEATPIAATTKLFEVVEKLRDAKNSLEAAKIVPNQTSESAVINPEFTSEFFEDNIYAATHILNKISSVENEMPAEGDKFISNLKDLRRDIETTSRTNWDIIVVRTAIIILAMVAVKIFHNLMMTAISERRNWEQSLSTLAILDRTSIDEQSIDSFLKIMAIYSKSSPSENQQIQIKDLADILKSSNPKG